MNMDVKICGLSTKESVIAVRDGGASHAGFIFFEKSPRHVTSYAASQLVEHAGNCKTVAVTVNADDVYLNDIVGVMKPDMLQLHGSETPQRVAELKERHGLPVIKAFSIATEDDFEKTAAYDGVADILLVDAKPPEGADLPGGNGISFNWGLLEKLTSATPVWLSGGISLDNAEEALRHVADPDTCIKGLDVSSGVESAPGVKDEEKIAAFLAVCRAQQNA